MPEDELEPVETSLEIDEGVADVERVNAVSDPQVIDENEPEFLSSDTEYEVTLDDGRVVASDMYGNPLEPVDDEPEPEPVVETPKPVQEFHSPYTNSQLTQADIAEAEALGVDPQVLGLIDRIADRRAMQAISAQEQQRAAARQIGISQEALDEFAPAMRQYESMVPANVRGTKEGAVTALLMAAGAEAMKTGDLGAVLQRMIPQVQQQVQTPAPVRKTPDITPAQRSTTPRASSATVAPARTKPRDAANASFGNWGADGDIVSMLQRERNNSKM